MCHMGMAGFCLHLRAVSHCSAAILFLNDTCGLVNATGCLPSPRCHQAVSCPDEDQGDAEVEGPHLQLVSAAVGRAARARHPPCLNPCSFPGVCGVVSPGLRGCCGFEGL